VHKEKQADKEYKDLLVSKDLQDNPVLKEFKGQQVQLLVFKEQQADKGIRG
jgi:hypothetical protein